MPHTNTPSLPLLMTASISTRDMKGACFTDRQREQMYISTLRYYTTTLLCTNPAQKIIFADNSGWNMENIKKQITPPINIKSNLYPWIKSNLMYQKGKDITKCY